jgi:hypothetical protein
VLPSFPFLSFVFYFLFLYSPHLCTSCSFCCTRSSYGRSGVKKGLLCPGNRTWVTQPIAYRLRHIYIYIYSIYIFCFNI